MVSRRFDSFGSSSSNPNHMNKEQQDAIIKNLLDAMNNLQEALEPLGLSANDISWANDLTDAIQVLYFNEKPDGSFQNELAEEVAKGETELMDFEEAKECLITRIANMSDGWGDGVAKILRF